jgi:hypothetical protein
MVVWCVSGKQDSTTHLDSSKTSSYSASIFFVAIVPSSGKTELMTLSFLRIAKFYIFLIPRNAASPTAYTPLPLKLPIPVSEDSVFVANDWIDGGLEDWEDAKDKFECVSRPFMVVEGRQYQSKLISQMLIGIMNKKMYIGGVHK